MSLFYDKEKQEVKAVNVGVAGILTLGIVYALFAGIGPIYHVWEQGLQGEAELKKAEQNRHITVLEAQAGNEAATSQAEAKIKIAQAEATAEVERAKGVAQANAIIGDSLKGNEDYLRYLYITGLTAHANQIVYIPTEATLPILEAGKR